MTSNNLDILIKNNMYCNYIYFNIFLCFIIFFVIIKMLNKNILNLKGNLLMAMPDIGDERFTEFVILFVNIIKTVLWG